MDKQRSTQSYISIAAGIIVLIIFNSIYFATCGVDGNASGWITYGFMSVALISMMAISAINFHKVEVKMRAMLNSATYCIAELIIGIIFLIIAPETITWTLVVQGSMFGIALIAQLMCLLIDNQE